jgi:hypothetical protein
MERNLVWMFSVMWTDTVSDFGKEVYAYSEDVSFCMCQSINYRPAGQGSGPLFHESQRQGHPLESEKGGFNKSLQLKCYLQRGLNKTMKQDNKEKSCKFRMHVDYLLIV